MKSSRMNAVLLGCARAAVLATALAASAAALAQDKEPADDHSPAVPAPKADGIVVLFSGKADEVAANWTKRNPAEAAVWPVEKGSMTSKGGDIVSKQTFEDFQLHVEFKVPYMPDQQGQHRGNSGVFLQGRYEVQVLDSYGKASPGTGDCAAIYNKAAALINACKQPRQWQTYDINFRAPRLDAEGKVVEKARITVFQNGICVQNNTEVDGVCGGAINNDVGKAGPIMLQDHGNPMQYRNVWVLPIPKEGNKNYQ